MSGRAVGAIGKTLWVTCNVGRRIAARDTRDATRLLPRPLPDQTLRTNARVAPPAPSHGPTSPPSLIVFPSPCLRPSLHCTLLHPSSSSPTNRPSWDPDCYFHEAFWASRRLWSTIASGDECHDKTWLPYSTGSILCLEMSVMEQQT